MLKISASIPKENLLAAAFWFYGKKNNPARSAFILEQTYKLNNDPWILDLHHDAYAASSPSQIENEVLQTKNRLDTTYSPESNIALLM